MVQPGRDVDLGVRTNAEGNREVNRPGFIGGSIAALPPPPTCP